jgi:hypothetical protein
VRRCSQISQNVSVVEVRRAESKTRPDARRVILSAYSYRNQLVDSGLLIDLQSLQKALSLTAGDIADAVREGRLFRVDVSEEQYYPAFFANKTIPLTVLESVSLTLGPLSGWLKWDFFTAARGSLGDKSPLEALALGQMERVIARAESFRDELLR